MTRFFLLKMTHVRIDAKQRKNKKQKKKKKEKKK